MPGREGAIILDAAQIVQLSLAVSFHLIEDRGLVEGDQAGIERIILGLFVEHERAGQIVLGKRGIPLANPILVRQGGADL